MVVLFDYNTYVYESRIYGAHALVKSHFRLAHEDEQAELLDLIKKPYIHRHMDVTWDTENTHIPMFLYEKLEPKDLKQYHTKEEIFAFLKEYFLVTWDNFEGVSIEGNQEYQENEEFLRTVLFPQLDISTECYVINADEIDEKKIDKWGKMVYYYYLLLMWKDSENSLRIAVINSD